MIVISDCTSNNLRAKYRLEPESSWIQVHVHNVPQYCHNLKRIGANLVESMEKKQELAYLENLKYFSVQHYLANEMLASPE